MTAADQLPELSATGKVLVVTSRFPYPPNAGDKLRVFNILKGLALQYPVMLIAQGLATQEEIACFRADSGVDDIQLFDPPPSWIRICRGIMSLTQGKPLQVGYFANRLQQNAVRKYLPDAIAGVFHLIRTSAMKPDATDTPCILEMSDAISSNLIQTNRAMPRYSPRGIISGIEGRLCRSFERHEAGRFERVSIINGKEARDVGIPNDKVFVCTNGVDGDSLVFRPPDERPQQYVTFIGRVDYFANVRAIHWFISRVLPILPSHVKLKVVGQCSRAMRVRLEKSERVVVTGPVESISSACEDCAIGIAPLDVATGVQNKVLEYFALGLPAVISPMVLSGMEASIHKFSLVRKLDEPENWARSISDVMRRPSDFVGMTLGARQWVLKHHSWQASGDKYANLVRGALDVNRRGSATSH